MEKNKTASALSNAFKFTPEELEMNRAGHLAASQHRAMMNMRFEYNLDGLVLTGVLGGMFFFVSMSSLITGGYKGTSSALPLIIINVLSAIGLCIFVWIFWRAWMDVQADKRDGLVEHMQGVVRLKLSGTRPTRYRLYMHGEEFQIPPDAALAMSSGTPYLIHFAPHSRVILSAEAVE